MADFERTPPLYYRIVAVLLTLWGAIGCYACFRQIRFGADAMGVATDYDRAFFAALPIWYNGCYAIAVFAALFGGLALLARSRAARPLFLVALIAAVVQFGFVFVATDLIAHKGFFVTVPFPVLVVVACGFGWWFAGYAQRWRWIA